jgi:hypothetical protein
MSISIEQSVFERLANIEGLLARLLNERLVRDHYTVEQFAQRVERDPFTVREWCRRGRIRAAKKGSGRGRYQAWVIGHAEFLRFEREGLLPMQIRNG